MLSVFTLGQLNVIAKIESNNDEYYIGTKVYYRGPGWYSRLRLKNKHYYIKGFFPKAATNFVEISNTI